MLNRVEQGANDIRGTSTWLVDDVGAVAVDALHEGGM